MSHVNLWHSHIYLHLTTGLLCNNLWNCSSKLGLVTIKKKSLAILGYKHSVEKKGKKEKYEHIKKTVQFYIWSEEKNKQTKPDRRVGWIYERLFQLPTVKSKMP